jgi:hypothetical protein
MRRQCKQPRPRDKAAAKPQMACMLPSPVGSGPPAISDITQPRLHAHARRHCVQRAGVCHGGRQLPCLRRTHAPGCAVLPHA